MTTLTRYGEEVERGLVNYGKPGDVEAADDVEAAFALDQELKAAVQAVKRSWWRMARACYCVREGHVWVKLGYELEDYLADAEIGLRPSQFYDLAKLWDELRLYGIEREEVEQIDQTKVRIVLRALKSGQLPGGEAIARADVLADLKRLSRSDIVEKYRKRQSGMPESADADTPEQVSTADTLRGASVRGGDDGGILSPAELDVVLDVDDVEVLAGEVLDPVEPGGPIMRGQSEALPAPVVAFLQGARIQSVRKDIWKALDSGATFPRVPRHTVEVLDRLLDLLLGAE